jgi:Spy/CpxP family protein refolding chaperone
MPWLNYLIINRKAMKTFWKTGMIVSAITLLPLSSINAQPGPGHHHGEGYGPPDSCHIQLMVDDMAKQLSLTDQQKQQILNIHYKHMQDMKALQDKYKNDCAGEQEARRQLREQVHNEVMAVLSKDQQAKWNEIIKEKHGPHGGQLKWENNPADKN